MFRFGSLAVVVDVRDVVDGIRRLAVFVRVHERHSSASASEVFATDVLMQTTDSEERDAKEAARSVMSGLCNAYYDPEGAMAEIESSEAGPVELRGMMSLLDYYIQGVNHLFVGQISEACASLNKHFLAN